MYRLIYASAIVFLLIGISDIESNDFYFILRCVVTLAFIFSIANLSKVRNSAEAGLKIVGVLGILLFQPLYYIVLSKSLWILLDIAASMYFIAMIEANSSITGRGIHRDNEGKRVKSAIEDTKRYKWRDGATEFEVDTARTGVHRFDRNYFDDDEIRYNKFIEALTAITGVIVFSIILIVFFRFSQYIIPVVIGGMILFGIILEIFKK